MRSAGEPHWGNRRSHRSSSGAVRGQKKVEPENIKFFVYAAHEEAIRLRLKANCNRTENSYSNMSSLLLRLGRPDEAEEMMAWCPSLQGLTDESFLKTGNPGSRGYGLAVSHPSRAGTADRGTKTGVQGAGVSSQSSW